MLIQTDSVSKSSVGIIKGYNNNNVMFIPDYKSKFSSVDLIILDINKVNNYSLLYSLVIMGLFII